MVLPIHKLRDRVQEEARDEARLGTTGRGIGPCYSDKAARLGIRVGDVLDPEVGINVVDLGLIQNVLVRGRTVEIRMKLTSAACPVADLLMSMVQHKTEEAIRDSSLELVRVVLVDGNATDG